jgi:hypothetical protein
VGTCRAQFLAIADTLAFFGPTCAAGRTGLREWMACVPGDAPPEDAAIGRAPALSRLIEEVAREFGVSTSEIQRGLRRREVSRARAVAAHLACDALGFSEANVAPQLGVGETSLGRARQRGRIMLPQGPPGLAHVVLRMVPGRKD